MRLVILPFLWGGGIRGEVAYHHHHHHHHRARSYDHSVPVPTTPPKTHKPTPTQDAAIGQVAWDILSKK